MIQLGRFVHLSPDFQYRENPGYNRDPGPVKVYGIRLRSIIESGLLILSATPDVEMSRAVKFSLLSLRRYIILLIPLSTYKFVALLK